MRLVVLWLFVACVHSDAVTCEFGTCPPGTACDEEHDTCVAPDQLTSCIGKEHRAPCDGVADGVCLDGVCLVPGCGNAIIEPEIDEQCEVGTGEPCSADCFSTLTCRNGVVDIETDEQCDDHNELAHDGCTSSCVLESPSWLEVPGFTARHGAAMTYDALRGRIVLYGGVRTGAQTRLGDLWEWDGVRWHPQRPAVSPGPREQSALAFDTQRGVSVLFGGLDVGAEAGDTWEWDGARWSLRVPTGMVPRPRYGHAMTYVPGVGVVLFGGKSGAYGDFNDTWVWDGGAGTWTLLATADAPPKRRGHHMTYDPIRKVVVLFGGVDTSSTLLGDTWHLSGSTWSMQVDSGPSARTDHAMTFDPISGKTLVLGGDGTNATWLWDGTTWTTGANMITPITGGVAAVEIGGGSVIAVGALADTYRWNGTQWARTNAANDFYPWGRNSAAVARDGRRRRVYIFGGNWAPPGLPYEPTSEMLVYDGAWRSLTTDDPQLGARAGGGMVFDDARDRLVVFGGSSDTSTWTSQTGDENSWTQYTGTSPAARSYHAMAYDAARERVVLFGGAFGLPTQRNDTWLWDGASWMQATPPTVPGPRERATIAYDPIRQRVVMFGGVLELGGAAIYRGDTWLWDGTNWQEATPNATPAPRASATLTWDAGRQRLVMFGGDSSASVERDDAWEWDGTNWQQVPVPSPIKARTKHAAWTAFDGGGVVVYGGFFEDVTEAALVDAYQLTWSGATPDETCLADTDVDGDTKKSCDDPDCWSVCTPTCPPGAMCAATAPHCGDDDCNELVESVFTCPADCPD